MYICQMASEDKEHFIMTLQLHFYKLHVSYHLPFFFGLSFQLDCRFLNMLRSVNNIYHTLYICNTHIYIILSQLLILQLFSISL